MSIKKYLDGTCAYTIQLVSIAMRQVDSFQCAILDPTPDGRWVDAQSVGDLTHGQQLVFVLFDLNHLHRSFPPRIGLILPSSGGVRRRLRPCIGTALQYSAMRSMTRLPACIAPALISTGSPLEVR